MGLPVAWAYYDSFLLEKNNGTQDLDTDVFNVALFLSASNCADLTITTFGSLTGEHAEENGYLQGGLPVTPTLTGSPQNVNFTTSSAEWTATGGNIVARFAVKYNTTTGGLVGYSLMDDEPADKTATDGNTFTVSDNASGMFDEAPV